MRVSLWRLPLRFLLPWLILELLDSVASTSQKPPYRILSIPSPLADSHKYNYANLASELRQKGHSVTTWQLSMKDDNDKRWTEPGDELWTVEVPEKYMRNLFLYENSTIYSLVLEPYVDEVYRKGGYWAMSTRVCELMLESRTLKAKFDALLKRNFDLIILDDLYNTCGLLYAGLNRIPVVYWSHTLLRPESAWSSQSPFLPAFVPVPGTGYSETMSFPQRLFNLLSYIKTIYIHQSLVLKPIHALFQNHFPGMPHPFDIERNASLYLVNGMELFDFPRPFMPKVAMVGCLQCKLPGERIDQQGHLAQDLSSFVQKFQKRGFFLFTTGFSIKWPQIPTDKIKMFLEAFRQMPEYGFVWQYEGPSLGSLPPNVLLKPWLPQTTLLDSKHCVGLITTGGLNSVQEALWHGKPMLGVPVFWEHEDYLLRATQRDAGLLIQKQELSTDILVKSLKALLRSNKYTDNARALSELYQDVLWSPMQTAVHWIEFLAKHKQVPFARSGADLLSLSQYFLLDVVIFLVFLVISFVGVVLLCANGCVRCCGYMCNKEPSRSARIDGQNGDLKCKKDD